MNSSTLIQMLKDAGWTKIRSEGGHHIFEHAAKPDLLTVPEFRRELPAATLEHILRTAGLK